jgi:hypothetical protein
MGVSLRRTEAATAQLAKTLFTVMTFSNAVLTRHFLKIFIEIPKA